MDQARALDNPTDPDKNQGGREMIEATVGLAKAQTVVIHIAIKIDTEEDVDTGVTVEEWNAMTDDQRLSIAREQWNNCAERDNGGMAVVTDGAQEI